MPLDIDILHHVRRGTIPDAEDMAELISELMRLDDLQLLKAFHQMDLHPDAHNFFVELAKANRERDENGAWRNGPIAQRLAATTKRMQEVFPEVMAERDRKQQKAAATASVTPEQLDDTPLLETAFAKNDFPETFIGCDQLADRLMEQIDAGGPVTDMRQKLLSELLAHMRTTWPDQMMED